MVVIKASDNQEEFSFHKLILSIKAANENTDEPLDIDLLKAEFQTIILDKEFVTTGEIKVIVYGLLWKNNAVQTLKNYTDFSKRQ